MMTQQHAPRRGGRGHAIVEEAKVRELLKRYEAGETLGPLADEAGITKPGLSQRFTKIRNDPNRKIADLEARIADLEEENAELYDRLKPKGAGETRDAIVEALEGNGLATFEILAGAAFTTEKRVRACVYANPKMFSTLKDRDGLVFVRLI